MTEEEKQLLFNDLCARLPYGVKVRDSLGKVRILSLGNADLARLFYEDSSIYSEKELSLPYLRPMDSMTDEERDEYEDTLEYDRSYYYTISTPTIKTIDWLLRNHFDYRRLIEKGLAIEAPKNLY